METKDKPVWLLDVDGVIFPEGSKPGWSAAPVRTRIIVDSGDPLLVRFSLRLIKEIQNIHKSGLVDIWWATSWVDEADKLEKLFSLPPLTRAFPSCDVGGIKEKTLAARKIYNSGRRLIWTDDAVVPQWGPFYEELTMYGQSLLISPNPSKGLQPEDINEIKRFIGIKVSS